MLGGVVAGRYSATLRYYTRGVLDLDRHVVVKGFSVRSFKPST